MTRDPFERYEAKPFPGSSHTWAFEQIDSLLEGRTAVLDIGPGSGILGQYVRSRGITDLSGVEVDEATRLKLESSYDNLVSSLEELPSEKKYDIVLLLDVLEHMANPYEFLQLLAPRLSSGAVILISVPNITHWAVRLMMLFGFFDYMERGPLDRTHLQFFSRKRFLHMLRSIPGGSILGTSGTIEPLELFLPNWLSDSAFFKTVSQLRLALVHLWPALFAYQHVGVVLTKESAS